jgi:hypothetical protein
VPAGQLALCAAAKLDGHAAGLGGFGLATSNQLGVPFAVLCAQYAICVPRPSESPPYSHSSVPPEKLHDEPFAGGDEGQRGSRLPEPHAASVSAETIAAVFIRVLRG